MNPSRRSLLSMAATGAAFAGLSRLAHAQDLVADAVETDPYLSQVAGYGPLVRDPRGIFDLPEGFSYTVVSKAGDRMSDGLITPRKLDGMGCFPLDDDRVVLVRNQELKLADVDHGPLGPGDALIDRIDRTRIYDRNRDGLALGGGTTTLVYDLRRRALVSDHLSLLGTTANCSGGTTPWGSWLSCEEAHFSPGEAVGHGVGKSHGWVFEVPSSARGLVDPVPLTGMGRFQHEAACIDPRTGIVYMTEDEFDGFGLFYRFLPQDRMNLAKGGRLQALGFRDAPTAGDSRNWAEVAWRAGDWREAVWIDLDGVDNPEKDLRHRGHAKGAAWFARGEGIFFGDGELYFTCTSGGAGRLGQVMRYRPSRFEGDPRETDEPGGLQLFLEPTDPKVMQMGDNLAVSPWGHLFICEDKVADRGVNYLRAVTPKGQVYTVGRQALTELSGVGANSELAGVCFSPDGTTLFVNIYWPGMTLAITGPWGRLQG